MEYFSYHEGELYAEEVAISTITDAIKPPFYLYSARALRHNFKKFQEALHASCPNSLPLIAYALKANSNSAVLRLLAREGAGADVVSGGELYRALNAGINPQKIVFSGVGKTSEEMDFALTHGILCFNIESEAELYHLNDRAQRLGLKAPISLRVNPDVDAGSHAKISTGRLEDKFGISYHKAPSLYAQAAKLPNIEARGIDVHIGSQICQLAPFDKAFARIAHLTQTLRENGHPIRHIDVGGGLGIDYFNGEEPPSVTDYAQIISRHFAPLDIDLICEPGRLIVGNAGILVTKVLYLKQTDQKNFIIVDAAMNDLIRPTLYEARHKIIPVRLPDEKTALICADIVGPVCESGDFLAQNHEMTLPKQSDLLSVMSAGAYGATMSSSYNSRPLVPEVLVSGDQFYTVRRRPSYEEMLDLEHVPDWLR